MRILEIDQREFKYEDGLGPIWLSNLRRIVVLAGPNGAGKSRLIKRVHLLDGFSGVPPTADLDNVISSGAPRPFDVTGLNQARYFGVTVTMNRQPGVAEQGNRLRVVPYITTNLNIPSADVQHLNTQIKHFRSARKPGLANIVEGGLSYVRRLMDLAWDAKHPDFLGTSEDRTDARLNFERLRDDVCTATGVEIRRDIHGRMTFDGRPFDKAALSEGQRRLLIWIIAIHAQGDSLGDLILTFDEPELNVHPKALFEAISRIISINAHGQIWIATHSVNIIASLLHNYADDVSLFCVENGNAANAGREPERVLKSLIGGEENALALKEFIDLPEVMATNRFAAECLLPPTVVDTAKPTDPQVRLAEVAIFSRPVSKPAVRVLDFGAGSGRLLDSLAIGRESTIKDVLDYVAWDIAVSPSRSKCEAAIAKYYGDDSNRWFSDRSALSEKYGGSSFDAVVMCNVLHESNPSDWLAELSHTGLIATVLEPDGWLLIIEDYLMPKGEHAHPFGFIVLDTEALRVLFGAEQASEQFKVIRATSSYANRIKAHQISRQLLRNVNADRRRRALELANRNAEDKLRALRGGARSGFRSGQEHAFWVQQFANTQLALKDLG